MTTPSKASREALCDKPLKVMDNWSSVPGGVNTTRCAEWSSRAPRLRIWERFRLKFPGRTVTSCTARAKSIQIDQQFPPQFIVGVTLLFLTSSDAMSPLRRLLWVIPCHNCSLPNIPQAADQGRDQGGSNVALGLIVVSYVRDCEDLRQARRIQIYQLEDGILVALLVKLGPLGPRPGTAIFPLFSCP